MTDLRELVWQEAAPMLFMSREQFFAHLDGWTIEPFEVDGEPAFAMLTKGAEFHLVTFKTGRRFPMKAFMKRLRTMLDEHGYATTRTPKIGEDQQHRINERFGFVPIGEDWLDIHYRLDRQTFVQRRDGAASPERETCQQLPL